MTSRSGWHLSISSRVRAPLVAIKTPVDKYSNSFSGDRAVVSNNRRRLAREERSGRGPHKVVRVSKNYLHDKQNALGGSDAYLRPHVTARGTL